MPILTPTRGRQAVNERMPKSDLGMSALEKDTVFGFCGPITGDFLSSARRHYPEISVNVSIHGFKDLREQFLKSNKRFWVYIGEGITFLGNKDLWAALATMIDYGLGAVGLYASSDKDISRAGLKFQETGWVPGYFMLVDSRRVGHVEVDPDFPDGPCLADLSYSLQIKADGYAVGIAPGVVFLPEPTLFKNEDIKAAEDYLSGKYGSFYHNNAMAPKQIGGAI